ncbi:MAG: DMT family transporter [Terriglobia bacterium]
MNLLMLWATVFWAANAVAGKFALRGFPPMALAELRVVGAAAGFWLVFIVLRGWPRFHLTRREWIFMGLAGLNGVTLNQVFYLGGLSKTSVAHTALIIALGPIVVLALACALHMESWTAGKTFGVVVAFCGVAVLTIARPSKANGTSWTGDLLLLVGRLAFAYYTILMKQGAEHYDALTLNALTFTVGAVFLIPFSVPSLVRASWRNLPSQSWEGLAFMVIFGTVLAYLVYAFALTVMTASQAAAFSYLAPVIAIALGVWLLSESITWRVWAGGAMILLGIFFTGKGGAEEPEAAMQ